MALLCTPMDDASAARKTAPGRVSTWLVRSVLIAILCVEVVATGGLLDGGVRPANAQWWGENPYGRQRARPAPGPQQRSGFGFPFFDWGGPAQQWPDRDIERRPRSRPAPQQAPQQADFSKAPAPRKADVEAGKSVLVLGDSMADWLGSGLEDAFADSSEFGVARKARSASGLIRNEPRDHDWLQTAREALAGEKADYVVMMIGLSDRHAIRERPPARVAPAQPLSLKPGDAASPDQPAATAPEAERPGAAPTHEFRSEKWVELYSKRIDDMIAVLKSKRVPVLWVGLPPIRGTRSRAEVAFLNDLYKARAEKAGVAYVDVWEGFVDDAGEFSILGPDVMGQVRRLRTGDGVHFTKFGARKLAHYVDREIRRLIGRETPIALPVPDFPEKTPAALAAPSGPAPRPVAGPVMPLTGGPTDPGGLLGSRGPDSQTPDPTAVRVLVKGEPLTPAPGRADNFAWPRPLAGSENDIAEPPNEAIAPRPAASAPAAQPARPTTRVRPGQKPAAPADAAPAPARSAGSAPARAVR